ncbi:MAG: AMP-binding protein [Alphaproteobacteria bacterium]|nr:AMP-binding protein [Alphaproteobacteria bacterium]
MARKSSNRAQAKSAKRPPTARKAATRKAAAPKRGLFDGLDYGKPNFTPLSPADFLWRSAEIHPRRIAVIHGERRFTYAEFLARARRLAAALKAAGVRRGQVVSAMLPNVPAMLEAHFAVPMLGAVLNTINVRLDARTIAYILEHGEAKVLIADREFAGQVGPALAQLKKRPLVIEVDDPLYDGPGERLGDAEYEAFIAKGDPELAPTPLDREDRPIALNYTSGTTGNPKGVVYHHRGCYLETVGNIMAWPLAPKPVYLWTLPLFHCNGWCFPWSVTAMGGTHVCLRRVDPAMIFQLIAEHQVTHMCGAPTVLGMLIGAPVEQRRSWPHKVAIQTGGASPPAKVIRAMNELGFRVTHIYGMTELQGPSTLCEPQDDWAGLAPEEEAARHAHQGVRYPVVAGQMVADPKSLKPVPKDGRTIGEVLIQGNTVMLGYLKNPKATAEAFKGGWMHTGDLAVAHPSGYIEIKDRAKDIIISGGENISSIEVEIALVKHPAVALAAVVARPDEKWGETVCAFVQFRPGAEASEAELMAHCRANLPRYCIPRSFVFGGLPLTATGKVQKYTLRERARAL